MQIDPKKLDPSEQTEPYWTMMSLGGELLNLDDRLVELLGQEDFKDCKAQSVMVRGGLT